MTQANVNTCFAGWETYPANLASAEEERFTYDHERYCSRLRQAAPLYLAESRDDTRIKIVHLHSRGSKVDILKDGQELDSYLQSSAASTGTRVYLIPSVALKYLLVSEECLRKLLSTLQAFPPVLDAVHAFGKSDGDSIRSGTAFSGRSDPVQRVTENCWLLQHVEQHGRADQRDPWSIRQMGVYIKTDELAGRNDIVILNPSDAVKTAVNGLKAPEKAVDQVKTLLMSVSTRNWRDYSDNFESRLNHMQTHIGHQFNNGIEFGDMRAIQHLRHQVCQARTAMSGNVQIIKQIKQAHTLASATSTPSCSAIKPSHVAMQCEFELESLLVKNKNLLTRTEGASTLISGILDYHTTQATQSSNQKAAQMQQLANRNNEMMYDMTKRSIREAKTLKWLSILTLFYLPASFVATFMGMDYLTIEGLHPFTLTCAGEMCIFGILTVFLLLITLSCWALFEVHQQRQERRQQMQMQMPPITKGIP